MPNAPRRIGVLLAAGRGSRMGGTKQLLSWPSADGPKPLICAAYDSIQPFCDQIIVVVGHEANAVTAALVSRPFQPVESSSDEPMFHSVRAGLLAAVAHDPAAMVILQPGDHPEVKTSTLQKLLDEALNRPTKAIIPQHAGRGGHPVLIPPPAIAAILNRDCPHGLGQFWLEHPEYCCRVPVDDAAVIRDVDTPEDLPHEPPL
jgi:molybdenum cofactor cytidylyltransferase